MLVTSTTDDGKAAEWPSMSARLDHSRARGVGAIATLPEGGLLGASDELLLLLGERLLLTLQESSKG